MNIVEQHGISKALDFTTCRISYVTLSVVSARSALPHEVKVETVGTRGGEYQSA